MQQEIKRINCPHCKEDNNILFEGEMSIGHEGFFECYKCGKPVVYIFTGVEIKTLAGMWEKVK